MEYADKMVLLQMEDYEKILKTALKLAQNNAYNDKFQLKVGNEYKSDTNIIDYILGKENLKYKKDYAKYSGNLYTKVSPVELKSNKKTKFEWVPLKNGKRKYP